MLLDLTFSTNHVQDFLSMGIFEPEMLDFDIEITNVHQYMKSDPLSESDEGVLIYIRNATTHTSEKRSKDMITTFT